MNTLKKKRNTKRKNLTQKCYKKYVMKGGVVLTRAQRRKAAAERKVAAESERVVEAEEFAKKTLAHEVAAMAAAAVDIKTLHTDSSLTALELRMKLRNIKKEKLEKEKLMSMLATEKRKTENKSRFSIPLFLHPRQDVILSNRYTAGSYLLERLKEIGLK